jgi:hypothetical protein
MHAYLMFIHVHTYIHTYRQLAEEQLEVAEAKLLASIARNAPAAEIDVRNQSLVSMRARLPVPGNTCFPTNTNPGLGISRSHGTVMHTQAFTTSK